MSVVGDVPGVGVVLDLSELTFIDASGIGRSNAPATGCVSAGST